MLHYVEKPESWISNTVNGGVYREFQSSLELKTVFDNSLFDEIKVAMDEKTARAAWVSSSIELTESEDPLVKPDEILRLEQDVIAPLAAARKMYVYQTKDFWRQMKTAAWVEAVCSADASSAVTASSLYLSRIYSTSPELLAKASSSVIPPAYIDPTATIDPTAKVGPNVAIGPGVRIGEGVRVKDAIIMEGSTLEKHSCVLNSIVGTNCHIGPWARVEGLPEPEQDVKGQISVTVLGKWDSSNWAYQQRRRSPWQQKP